MPRFFQPSGQTENGVFEIVGEDAKHISFSLRMRVGERLTVCDGVGTDHECEIVFMDGQRVRLSVLSSRPTLTEPPIAIRLYQSVPKGDKFEYIVQKAVELGVCEIVPVYSSRCIVKPDPKSEEKKIARLSRIAAEAAKQCGRGRLPKVLPYITYAEAVRTCEENAFICYENEKSYSLKQYLKEFSGKEAASLSFFVGPEGGYSDEEITLAAGKGIPAVELGPRILRCETASGFVLSSLTFAFEL
ncbi:MAG: 16S rRNA (uracil(1498)-N(3))-methyltransferase [Clostridia bacterium]|nr:16S rRNA (uracil(1498)-N(3))-methyltransferase [Clostridia bacterium]